MLKTESLSRVVIIGLSLLLICSPSLFAQSSAGEQLLKTLPAKTLFCVQINNLDKTLNQIDQFLSGVSPMGISMPVRAQIMSILGNQQLTGLDMNGNFAIFGAEVSTQKAQDNPASNIFVGILAPVMDYKQFINSNPNCTQPDDKGVSTITQNGRPFTLLMQTGNYALLTGEGDYDKLVSIREEIASGNTIGLAANLNTYNTKLSTSAPVWVYGNIQQVFQTFEPQISAAFEQMKNSAKTITATDAGMTPATIQNIIDMYANIIDVLMKQAQSVSIAVDPKPEVLNVTGNISSVPETDMAKMFTENTSAQQDNKPLSYLEDGAVMNYQLNMNSPLLRQIQVQSIDILATMAGENMNIEELDKMKALTNEVLDSIGGPVAYSVFTDTGSQPPFAIKYAIAVKDESKFSSLIEEAMEMINTSGFLDFYKSMGMEMNFEINQQTGSYKDVSIDSARFTMKSTDPTSPQAQMIASMYGDGIAYRWAIVNGLFVCAAGGDVDSTIRELIDRAQADSSQVGTEINKAMSLLPGAQQADFLVTLNLLRAFNMISAILPVPIPQMDAQTNSNIAAIGKAADGQLVVNIALPKEHIQEIMTAVLAMQQQMMMQQQTAPSPDTFITP